MKRRDYISDTEFDLVRGRGGDVVIVDRRKKQFETIEVPQFPLAWMTPYVQDGLLMFGDGYGLTSGLEASNISSSFATGTRWALNEVFRATWHVDPAANPEWLYATDMVFDVPTILDITTTLPVDQKARIDFDDAANAESDGERTTILAYLNPDGRIAIAEKLRHAKQSGHANAPANIYSAEFYPYYIPTVDFAFFQFYAPTGIPGEEAYYRATEVVGYYYTEQEVADDTDLFNYTPP